MPVQNNLALNTSTINFNSVLYNSDYLPKYFHKILLTFKASKGGIMHLGQLCDFSKCL